MKSSSIKCMMSPLISKNANHLKIDLEGKIVVLSTSPSYIGIQCSPTYSHFSICCFTYSQIFFSGTRLLRFITNIQAAQIACMKLLRPKEVLRWRRGAEMKSTPAHQLPCRLMRKYGGRTVEP